MIKDDSDLGTFDFNGRNRRPPTDPVNCLLSFVYSLLVLDLAEEFRPIVADSTVMTVVNNGEVSDTSFVQRAVGVSLTQAGRRSVIAAYERRLGQEISHPRFGYRVTYRPDERSQDVTSSLTTFPMTTACAASRTLWWPAGIVFSTLCMCAISPFLKSWILQHDLRKVINAAQDRIAFIDLGQPNERGTDCFESMGVSPKLRADGEPTII